jgi:hypothetical protein
MHLPHRQPPPRTPTALARPAGAIRRKKPGVAGQPDEWLTVDQVIAERHRQPLRGHGQRASQHRLRDAEGPGQLLGLRRSSSRLKAAARPPAGPSLLVGPPASAAFSGSRYYSIPPSGFFAAEIVMAGCYLMVWSSTVATMSFRNLMLPANPGLTAGSSGVARPVRKLADLASAPGDMPHWRLCITRLSRSARSLRGPAGRRGGVQ